jgi:predicted permease
MLLIFNDLISFFLLIIISFILVKIKVANESWLQTFNQYSFNISLPFLTFYSINIQEINWRFFSDLLVLNFLILSSITLIIYLIFKFLFKKNVNGGTWLFAFLYGNVAFIGIPLLKSILNDEIFPALIASIHLLFVMLFGLFFSIKLEGGAKTKNKINLSFFVKNPIIWSIVLGLLANYFYQHTIVVLQVPVFKMLAQTATPIILLSLGIFIKLNAKIIVEHWKISLLYSAIKFFIIPFLMYYGIKKIIPDTLLDVQFFQMAMPCALASFVLALKYQLNAKILASFIIISTLLFFTVIPFLILFLK